MATASEERDSNLAIDRDDVLNMLLDDEEDPDIVSNDARK